MYSQPWLKTNRPLPRCTAHVATAMRPIIPAAANGVRRPAANIRPAPISVAAASRACTWGQRIPIDSKNPAVPASPPAPNTLL